MSRPENRENLQSVADQIVWAISTYGMLPKNASGTRPDNTKRESIQSVNEAVYWLVTGT